MREDRRNGTIAPDWIYNAAAACGLNCVGQKERKMSTTSYVDSDDTDDSAEWSPASRRRSEAIVREIGRARLSARGTRHSTEEIYGPSDRRRRRQQQQQHQHQLQHRHQHQHQQRLRHLSNPPARNMETPPQLHDDSYAFQWGNQIPMLPVSSKALKYKASARIAELAQPKDFSYFHKALYRDLHAYSCGSPQPLWPVSEAAMTARCSDRILALSRPKTRSEETVQRNQRSSHRQEVSSDRLLQLSRAKETSAEAERRTPSPVSKAAMRHRPSSRLLTLATPPARRRQRSDSDDRLSRRPNSAVPEASERVREMSRPRRLHPEFRFDGPVDRGGVSSSALNWKASERLARLAKPTVRPSMFDIHHNPRAFAVSPAALRSSRSLPRAAATDRRTGRRRRRRAKTFKEEEEEEDEESRKDGEAGL